MDIDFRRAAPVRQLSDAVITMGAILLAYAAFDDITTDNATTFTVEYGALVLCGAWALGVALRLLRDGWVTLGVVSLGALAAGAWGQRAIGPGTVPSSESHYVATAAAVAWFLVLSVVLLVIGWRAHREWDASLAD
jgi:hypothetical protein